VSTQKISVSCNDSPLPVGKELVRSVIDPEIQRFEGWFGEPGNGNSSLTPMEREVMRAYLYQKLVGKI